MTSALAFKKARDFLLAHRENYDLAYREFAWPVLDEFNWAIDHFDAMAAGNSATALWIVEDDGRETRHTFEDLRRRSNQVANFLRRLGVRRGDRVLMVLPNEVTLWETMLASMKLGAVIIPGTMLLTGADLADRIDRGRIRHVVTVASEMAKFADMGGAINRISVGGTSAGWTGFEEAYREETSFVPDGPTKATDPMLLYFTSGTTSKPKLVLHSHQSYPVGHLSTMYWIGVKPGDVHWNISSPGWAKHAWSSVFAPWNAGATIFIFNYARFAAPSVLNTIGRCGVTSLCAPPTVWRMLIQEDLRAYPVTVRELICAGEPLNPEVIEQVRAAWGVTIRDGYGQTETTCQIGNSPGQMVKPGSMGRPLPGYRITLLDVDDKPASEGEISLPLDPPSMGLMQGYIDDPQKMSDVTRAGHYRTGDVASRDGDGYYTYVGRADDVFKSSGYRISPFELESVLLEHEAVAETAVVPSPEITRASVPKCFVAVTRGHEPSRDLAISILKFARERMAPYKRIRRLEFSDLPKTISGKIRRVELRRLEENRGAEARRPMEFWEEDFPELT